jgi:predicted CopG family antitoxin
VVVPTKTLSITDDAYHRLLGLKQSGESFSDVIGRLTGKEDLRRFVGVIPPELANELAAASKDFRSRFHRDARRR